jgi:hypothetical protein
MCLDCYRVKYGPNQEYEEIVTAEDLKAAAEFFDQLEKKRADMTTEIDYRDCHYYEQAPIDFDGCPGPHNDEVCRKCPLKDNDFSDNIAR